MKENIEICFALARTAASICAVFVQLRSHNGTALSTAVPVLVVPVVLFIVVVEYGGYKVIQCPRHQNQGGHARRLRSRHSPHQNSRSNLQPHRCNAQCPVTPKPQCMSDTGELPGEPVRIPRCIAADLGHFRLSKNKSIWQCKNAMTAAMASGLLDPGAPQDPRLQRVPP